MRWLIVCVLLTVCYGGSAQTSNRNNYKLLWKISGNGLKKPSYLFGTFHVQDKRAFDVSDSVLLKISECEAFALEFHPDSVTKAVVHLFLNPSNESGNALKDRVPPAEFKRLDSLMQLRAGVSLSEFKSPSSALERLSSRHHKKDYRTFLDAWLYNIARSKNKMMFGLEEYRAQVDLLNHAEFEKGLAQLKEVLESDELLNKNLFDSLLRKYEVGDIESIRKYMLRHTSTSDYKAIITDRNVVMANSIRAIIHKQSAFVAVGAGHLAGEEGIIQLLRDAGYSMTPVQSKFSGLAANYDLGNAVQKWVKYKSPEGGYSIEMPQRPVAFSPGNAAITFQTFFDIGTMTLYMTTHFPLSPELRNTATKKILDDLEKKISGTVSLKNRRDFNHEGCDGRELQVVSLGQNYKVQLFVRPPMAYMLMVGSSDTALTSEGRRFFASFKPETIIRTASHDFRHEAGAFAIEMPGKPSYNLLTPHDPTINRNYKIHLFQTSTEAGESFFIRYNDFPAGFVSPNDSTYLDELLKSVVDLMKGSGVRKHWGSFNKFPLLDFSFKANADQVAVMGKLVMRGNRMYLAMNAREANADSVAGISFLNSFRFLPFISAPVKPVSFPEGITLHVPVTFERDSASIPASNSKQYAFVDVNSGITYVLQVAKFEEYQESDSVDLFFENNIREYLVAPDSIISNAAYVLKEYRGRDYVVKSTITNALKRIRFVVCGDQLISLWAYLPSDYRSTTLPDTIFSAFSVHRLRNWNLFEDKTERLLRDVVSTDSVKRVAAEAGIIDHEFRKDDLPYIYKAISAATCSDIGGESYSPIRLFNILKQVNDDTTPGFIHTTYNALPESAPTRDFALAVLAHMHKRETVLGMLRLIQQDSVRRNISGYVTLEAFYDSLQLLETILPQLISRHSSFTETETLFELTAMALDSGALSADTRAKVMDEVLRAGAEISKASEGMVEEESSYDRRMQDYVSLSKLLVKVPFSSSVKDLLVRLHASRNVNVMAVTAPHLLKHKVKVTPGDLELIAAKALHRLRLFESLKEMGKEKLMSKRFRTNAMLAESDLCEYMAYEDGIPDKIEFLTQRTVRVKDTEQIIYIFRYQYEDGNEWYLGLSGGHAMGKNSPFTRGAMTVSFYEAFSGQDSVNDRIREYLTDYGATLQE